MSATARLMAFLGMDAAGFTKGVDQAERRTHGFGKTLDGMKGKLAAAFTVGAAIKIGKDALAMGDDIGEMAANLGITTDELQALSFMFKTSGSSAETFERAINKISGAIGDAQNGSIDATDKLTKMGVSMDQIDAGNPAAVLETIAKYLKENEYSAGSVADVFDVLGEKSKNLKLGLQELAEKGLKGVIKSASDAGRILTAQEIANLGMAQDKLDAAIDWAKKKAAEAVSVGAEVTTGKGAGITELPATGEENRRRADAKSAAKIEKEAAEIRKKTAYDLLTKEGKILELKKEQLKIDEDMSSAKSLTAKAELDKQRAELEAKIAALEKEKEVTHTREYDQFRRIGGGIIGQDVGNPNAIKARMLGLQSGPIQHTATEQESMKTRDMLLQIKRMVTLHERTNTILEHTKSGVY